MAEREFGNQRKINCLVSATCLPVCNLSSVRVWVIEAPLRSETLTDFKHRLFVFFYRKVKSSVRNYTIFTIVRYFFTSLT